MYVEVSLPLPLHRTFFYRCGADLFTQLQLGQRILVPFQARKLTGYVVRLAAELPDDFPSEISIKDVIGTIDSTTLISPEIFELTRWVAEYYLTSQGEVLNICLPPKGNLSSKKMVNLTMEGWNVVQHPDKFADLTKGSVEFLSVLAAKSPLDVGTVSQLSKHPDTKATLRELMKRGWVQIQQHVIDSRISYKEQMVVSLPKVSAANYRVTASQTKVLDALRSAGVPLPLASIVDQLGISSSVIKALAHKKMVVVSRARMHRDPFKQLQGFDTSPDRQLTEEQKRVLLELNAAQKSTFVPALLEGVTGSGKTEVYQSLIEQTLGRKSGALLLMPEIALTPRIAQGFRSRFGERVAILHSGLSDGERFDEWWRIKRGEALLVIGTRSAIFAPIVNLELIIVDEEHDGSYKQQESPRYQARDCALVRGRIAGAMVLLGSATPSLETSYNARLGKYKHLKMKSRVWERPMPAVSLIDMRREFQEIGRSSTFSRELLQQIQLRLERQEQVLILLNRRGFSASVLCRSCGQTIQCVNCSISLTFHRSLNKLACHYCSSEQRVPTHCPTCKGEHLHYQKEGTEKAEALLQKRFPKARIARLDRDSASRRDAHVSILRQFQKGETDILTGTQMIAKGHDFHKVTLVGILSADTALTFPDFRSSEKTFHLLSQMAGRAGRGEREGQVLIQTFHPEHYCLHFVKSHDYEGFYNKEIRFRQMMHYPPFTRMALVLVRDECLETAARTINSVYQILRSVANPQLRILGPALSPLSKLKNEYRFQLIIKSQSQQTLKHMLRYTLKKSELEGVRMKKVHVDVDPQNLM